MAEESSKAVIIDTGSGYCKAGLASDESPVCCFPTVYARDDFDPENPVHLVGEDAKKEAYRLENKRPMVRGIIKDWDAMEHIWQHCYLEQMKIDSNEHPLLTPFYPDDSKIEKENTAMVFFETFSVPGYCCMPGAVLALYGSGKTTGLVIDSGEDVTSVVPVADGYQLPYCHVMQEFGGRDVTAHLARLLGKEQVSEDAATKIKEMRGFVSPSTGLESIAPMSYQLPDGTAVTFTNEPTKAVETIFQPAMASSQMGLGHMIVECLYKLDAESRREFVNHLVLVGGNTLFKNFAPR